MFDVTGTAILAGLTVAQISAVSIFVVMMAAFIWGRLRFDIVAALALLAGIASGIVPGDTAFSGFSDDVVIIIAGALVTSRAIGRSGVADRLVRRSVAWLVTPGRQVFALSAIVLLLSAFVKNIGALSMALPAAYRFSHHTGTSTSRLLMPMSFASLLGGVTTLVGTSPNLIVSRIREDVSGSGFAMFDFAAVGLPVAIAGLVFLAVGHRLLPIREKSTTEGPQTKQIYTVEAIVPPRAPVAGQPASKLREISAQHVQVLGIIRQQHTRIKNPIEQTLKENDHLLLEGLPNDVDELIKEAGLTLPKAGARLADKIEAADELDVVEAVVTSESLLVGWSPAQLRLSDRFAVEIVGVKRRNAAVATRIKSFRFAVGDVVVLRTGKLRLSEVLDELNLLPLVSREIMLGKNRSWTVPIVILTIAMILMAMQIVSVPVAFFGAAVLIVTFGVLPIRDAYEALDPPVLITLACLIPLSDSLRSTGLTDMISGWLSANATALPPIGALALIMVTAMAVTPFLNNAATVLVAAPVAASFAQKLGYNADPFLMAVALGAALDFLTPIGHQCNMLVYGPGGYRFSDYARLGLPLSILSVAIGVPMIAWIWPV